MAGTGGGGLARERVDSLDALRGLLAICVMVYHLLIFRYDVHLLAVGTYSVYAFFVLSGFAMRWVAVPPPGARFPTRTYAVSRLARIAPLWWAAVLISVVTALPDRPEVRKLVENLTFVFAVTPTTDIPLGGWSIEIEVLFYVLFPFFAVFLRSRASLVALVVGAAVLRLVYVTSGWPSGRAQDVVHYQQMPTFLVFFAGGMLLAELRRGRAPRRDHLSFAAAIVVIAGIYACGWLDLWTIVAGPFSLVLVAACIAAVGLAAWAPNPTHPRLRWLGSTLGAISFATYLLHPLVYAGVTRLGLGDVPTIVATILATFGVAWCSYWWFEVPAGRWIRSRLAPTGAP